MLRTGRLFMQKAIDTLLPEPIRYSKMAGGVSVSIPGMSVAGLNTRGIHILKTHSLD